MRDKSQSSSPLKFGRIHLVTRTLVRSKLQLGLADHLTSEESAHVPLQVFDHVL